MRHQNARACAHAIKRAFKAVCTGIGVRTGMRPFVQVTGQMPAMCMQTFKNSGLATTATIAHPSRYVRLFDPKEYST